MLDLVVKIIVIGILLYLVNEYVPMEGRLKSLVNVLVIIAVILWVLSALFGVSLPLGFH